MHGTHEKCERKQEKKCLENLTRGVAADWHVSSRKNKLRNIKHIFKSSQDTSIGLYE